MSKPLPLHTYADILDVKRALPPQHLSPPPWGLMRTRKKMGLNDLGCRAVSILPFEILREIFEFYFDSSPAVYTLDGPLEPGIYNNVSQQINTFILAQVCRSWRAVVFSVPSFWNSICVVGPLYKQSYAVRSWLSRARRANIHLIQLDLRCAPHELQEATEEILAALIRYSSRWQDLHLEFRCTEFPDALFKLDPLKLQCLENIYTEFPPWAAEPAALNQFWSVVYQAPRLSRVGWSTANIPPPLTLRAWDQLTNVECENTISQSDLWSLLKASRRLRRLVARGIVIKDPVNPNSISSITHNTLETLDVEFKSPPASIYHNLVLPRLATLRIARASLSPGERPATAALALSRMLRWSSKSSRLESLTILDKTMPEDLLIGFFQLEELQYLKHLGVEFASEGIISSLRRASASRASILPQLSRLDVHKTHDTVASGINVYDQMYLARSSFQKLLRSRPTSFRVFLCYLGRFLGSDGVS